IRNPQYRIMVADARHRRDGRGIENIGLYRPEQIPRFIEIDSERAPYWLSVGAQPNESVEQLLKVTGDWQKFKGIEGADGSLQVAEPQPSKLDRFNKALEEAQGEPSAEAITSKRKAEKRSEERRVGKEGRAGEGRQDKKRRE